MITENEYNEILDKIEAYLLDEENLTDQNTEELMLLVEQAEYYEVLSGNKSAYAAGIQCHACEFSDPTVDIDQYHLWLNKPCPLCATIIITDEELFVTRRMADFAEIINDLIEIGALSFKMEGTDIDIEINEQGIPKIIKKT